MKVAEIPATSTPLGVVVLGEHQHALSTPSIGRTVCGIEVPAGTPTRVFTMPPITCPSCRARVYPW